MEARLPVRRELGPLHVVEGLKLGVHRQPAEPEQLPRTAARRYGPRLMVPHVYPDVRG
jgi:hypothetical protein